VTVRIRTVIRGPSSGRRGPNTSPDLARTGSDGVAEVHKRQAAARVRATFSSRSTARSFASAEARLFPRIHRPEPLVHLDRRRLQNRLSVSKMEASPSFTKRVGEGQPRAAASLYDPLEELQRGSLSRFAMTTASKISPFGQQFRPGHALRLRPQNFVSRVALGDAYRWQQAS
jgi:hypothetical protein